MDERLIHRPAQVAERMKNMEVEPKIEKIEKIEITKEFSENRFNNELIILANKLNEVIEKLNG